MKKLPSFLLLTFVASCNAPAPTPSQANPVGLAFSSSPPTVEVGQRAQFLVTLKANDGTRIAPLSTTWTSSDERIAQVSSAGNLLALASGHVTVSAAASGYSASTEVAISPRTSPVVIRGRVTDYAAGTPLMLATLKFALNGGASSLLTTTDNAGLFSLTVPAVGNFSVAVSDASSPSSTSLGSLVATWFDEPRDLLVDAAGNCHAEYGKVLDAETLQGVSGATITMGATMTTAADGSYRFDYGCYAIAGPGNTRILSIEHPDYVPLPLTLSRSVPVSRADYKLQHR
ncbi:MAG: Ig-like domain-containing protein [Gemmatimonadaceae bacterium]